MPPCLLERVAGGGTCTTLHISRQDHASTKCACTPAHVFKMHLSPLTHVCINRRTHILTHTHTHTCTRTLHNYGNCRQWEQRMATLRALNRRRATVPREFHVNGRDAELRKAQEQKVGAVASKASGANLHLGGTQRSGAALAPLRAQLPWAPLCVCVCTVDLGSPSLCVRLLAPCTPPWMPAALSPHREREREGIGTRLQIECALMLSISRASAVGCSRQNQPLHGLRLPTLAPARAAATRYQNSCRPLLQNPALTQAAAAKFNLLVGRCLLVGYCLLVGRYLLVGCCLLVGRQNSSPCGPLPACLPCLAT